MMGGWGIKVNYNCTINHYQGITIIYIISWLSGIFTRIRVKYNNCLFVTRQHLPQHWTGLHIKDKDRILIGIAYFLSSPRQRSKKKIDNRVFGCIWLWLLQKEYHQISSKLDRYSLFISIFLKFGKLPF